MKIGLSYIGSLVNSFLFARCSFHHEREMLLSMPMDRHQGCSKQQTIFGTFSPLVEKEMATHSSILAWRISGTEGPGGLPSTGLHRVRHNWSNLAAAAAVPSLLMLVAHPDSWQSMEFLSLPNRVIPFRPHFLELSEEKITRDKEI